MKRRHWLWGLVFLIPGFGCPGPPTAGPSTPPSPESPVAADGLHNVFRVTDKLYSGSSPDGEDGFRSLRDLGVKTVISVDGARPDVELARKYGLRYVHLPIGYDGVPEQQALRIARAVRDLPGPVYLHCHHGKHRGPAAAAVVHLFLDDRCDVEAAVADMRRAGTDPHYAGLYASPGKLRRPTREELDAVDADFPETAEVAALAQVMVRIDAHWERLGQVRVAGWKAPPAHPDLDPPHEALQLAEQYRETARLPAAAQMPEGFRHLLTAAESDARELERLLRRRPPPGPSDVEEIEKAFRALKDGCARCHAAYRDAPRP